MNWKPQITVILANWNGGPFLNQAMASVVHQTYQNWELIVVENGSTDDSHHIIEQWVRREERIKVIRMPRPVGCPAAVNQGLARAQGVFIARLDNDDLWYPERLQRQMAWLLDPAHQTVGVCGTDVVLLDAAGQSIGIKRYPRCHQDCLRAIWYRNPFCSSAVLIRRSALEQGGNYDPTYALVEDLELWFRLAQRWEFHNVPEALTGCRIWPGSLTTRKLRRLIWRTYQVRARAVRQYHWPIPWLARVYSLATLGLLLFPAPFVRGAFECRIRCFEPFVHPTSVPSSGDGTATVKTRSALQTDPAPSS